MTRATIAVLIAVGLSVPTFGQFVDDFSSSAVTSANWSSAAISSLGFNVNGTTSSIAFAQNESDDRLNFTGGVSTAAAVPPAAGTNRYSTLQTYSGSYDSNWSVQVVAANTFVPALSQSVQVGLLVSNAADASDYVKLVLLQTKQPAFSGDTVGVTQTVVHGGAHTNGTPNGNLNALDALAGGTATLKANYDASTHVFSTWYGSTQHGSFSVATTPPSGYDSNWNMATGGTFNVSLYAQVYNGSTLTDITLANGTAFLDDFSSTGLSAVPEPSTYAAIAGLAVLGLAAWRRRKAA